MTRVSSLQLQRIPGLIEVRLKNNPLSRVPKALISRRYYLVLSSNVRKESGALLLSTSNSGSSLRPTSPQPPSDECSLFGSDLETILAADRRRDPKLRIPFIAKHSINFILTTGMEVQGIFRLEGNAAAMAALREQAEAGDFVFDRMESPNNVAGLLKQWLRSLSRPPLIDLPAFLSIVGTYRTRSPECIALRSTHCAFRRYRCSRAATSTSRSIVEQSAGSIL